VRKERAGKRLRDLFDGDLMTCDSVRCVVIV
jgi:hypothetical protein